MGTWNVFSGVWVRREGREYMQEYARKNVVSTSGEGEGGGGKNNCVLGVKSVQINCVEGAKHPAWIVSKGGYASLVPRPLLEKSRGTRLGLCY